MTERYEIYECKVCGNIVEVLRGRAGKLVCCGQDMQKLNEKSTDQGLEKHVPVVDELENGILVKVGSVPHPMEESHYIEWIEVITSGKTHCKFLKPGDTPEAEFACLKKEDVIKVREHCNLHGLWVKT